MGGLLPRHIRHSMAERELSLNLSEDAKDLLVEKGWDPSMGARPLRRAIQRYIEDPLADEVLKAENMEPGATVEIARGTGEKKDDGAEGEPEVQITITGPPPGQKREPVAVGAESSEASEGSEGDGGSLPERSSGSGGLPDEPEVLPDVPDAPPADEPGPPSES